MVLAISKLVEGVSGQRTWPGSAASRAFSLFAAMIALLAISAPARAQVNLQVNKSFVPANVAVGQPSSLTIVVINTSSQPASSVAVTDNLPTSPALRFRGQG